MGWLSFVAQKGDMALKNSSVYSCTESRFEAALVIALHNDSVTLCLDLINLPYRFIYWRLN